MSKRSRRKKNSKRHPERKPEKKQEQSAVQDSGSRMHLWAASLLSPLGVGAIFLGLNYLSPSPRILYFVPTGIFLVLLATALAFNKALGRAAAMGAALLSVILFVLTYGYVTSRETIRQTAAQQGPMFKPAVDKVDLTLGSNDFVYDASELQKTSGHPLMLGGLAPITLYVEDDKLYADVALYNGPGQAAVEVKHNNFIVRPPGWDANSDSSALEVVDSQFRPVFQMSYASPQHIIINGYFAYPGGFVVATDAGMTINPTGPVPALTKLFRYPSWKYPNQRSQ